MKCLQSGISQAMRTPVQSVPGNPAGRRSSSLIGIALLALVVLIIVGAALLPLPALLPGQVELDREARSFAAIVIFIASCGALAIGKIPGLSIDRAGVALVGACLMAGSGVLPLEDVAAINNLVDAVWAAKLVEDLVVRVRGVPNSKSALIFHSPWLARAHRAGTRPQFLPIAADCPRAGSGVTGLRRFRPFRRGAVCISNRKSCRKIRLAGESRPKGTA